jgi:predicted nucleotidyltransferase component of viral defense system
VRYANERLLYRLSGSGHGTQFALKGATLFTLWTGQPHRSTRDIDLLGSGEASEERLREIFSEVLALDVGDDGVVFDAGSLEVGPIREDQEYGGIRVTLVAHVEAATAHLQIDVGFGDAITPPATVLELPTLLDFPAPRLRAYPRETAVAEKLEAMVKLGLANSRMKDFYDLVAMSRMLEFEGEVLVRAVRATFARRKTPLPEGLPVALTAAFAEDPTKRTQWKAFIRKVGDPDVVDLFDAIEQIVRFAAIPLAAAATGETWNAAWPAGGPWQK